MNARTSIVTTLLLAVLVWYQLRQGGGYTRWARLVGTAIAILLPLTICLKLFRDVVWGRP